MKKRVADGVGGGKNSETPQLDGLGKNFFFVFVQFDALIFVAWRGGGGTV